MVPNVRHAALSGPLAHDLCLSRCISSTEAVHCVHIAKPRHGPFRWLTSVAVLILKFSIKAKLFCPVISD